MKEKIGKDWGQTILHSIILFAAQPFTIFLCSAYDFILFLTLIRQLIRFMRFIIILWHPSIWSAMKSRIPVTLAALKNALGVLYVYELLLDPKI